MIDEVYAVRHIFSLTAVPVGSVSAEELTALLEFCNLALRIVSYKATEMRLLNKDSLTGCFKREVLEDMNRSHYVVAINAFKNFFIIKTSIKYFFCF